MDLAKAMWATSASGSDGSPWRWTPSSVSIARGLRGDGRIKNPTSLWPYSQLLRSACLCFITHVAPPGALDADLRTENVLRDSWDRTHYENVSAWWSVGVASATIRHFASILQSEAPGSTRLEGARIGPATRTLMEKRAK